MPKNTWLIKYPVNQKPAQNIANFNTPLLLSLKSNDSHPRPIDDPDIDTRPLSMALKIKNLELELKLID